MITNITDEIEEMFSALRDPNFTNFALYSCFVNEEPTVAIVVINENDDNEYDVTPLFVAVTSGMKIVNHDGEETA